jgi:hypothetical protein
VPSAPCMMKRTRVALLRERSPGGNGRKPNMAGRRLPADQPGTYFQEKSRRSEGAAHVPVVGPQSVNPADTPGRYRRSNTARRAARRSLPLGDAGRRIVAGDDKGALSEASGYSPLTARSTMRRLVRDWLDYEFGMWVNSR